jgi:hypothetical protein
VGGFHDIHRSPIVSKVSKDYTEIDKTSENTGTKTANRCQGNLSEIDWGNDNSLANTQACDEPSCIHGAEVTAIAHEDSNANNPENTQLASCPETTNTITDEERAK